MALDAGAELIDMENVSFLPGNNRAWGSQRSWGETPHFLNTKGERFMLRYNPSGAEFGTKEVLVHAIAQEVLEGRGTDKGGVYSDLTHLPWDNPSVRSDMSDLIEHGLRFGFDPKKKPVEMWPVAHTPTGGIPVNERCETSIPGLYAAGSTAGGIYGFGRIEGFTSIITQVYGKRAGEAAAARSLSAKTLPPSDGETEDERDRVLAVLDGREGTSPSLLKERIQSIMYQHAWILRDGPGLSEGLAKIMRLRDEKISVSSRSRAQNLEWVEALEVPNMLLMAELVIRASSLRTESRGSFARVDYPSADDETWLVNIAFKKSDGALDHEDHARPRGTATGLGRTRPREGVVARPQIESPRTGRVQTGRPAGRSPTCWSRRPSSATPRRAPPPARHGVRLEVAAEYLVQVLAPGAYICRDDL